MIRTQVAKPEHPDYPVVLLDFPPDSLVQTCHKLVYIPGPFALRLAAQKTFFGVLALVDRPVTVSVFAVAVDAVKEDEIELHYGQVRHDEASLRARFKARIH